MIDYDRYPGEHNGGYPSMEILEPEAIFDDPDNYKRQTTGILR